MTYFRNEIEVRESMNEFQKEDAMMWNNEVKKLNALYSEAKEYKNTTAESNYNNMIQSQKEHMKIIKPNWIKSTTK